MSIAVQRDYSLCKTTHNVQYSTLLMPQGRTRHLANKASRINFFHLKTQCLGHIYYDVIGSELLVSVFQLLLPSPLACGCVRWAIICMAAGDSPGGWRALIQLSNQWVYKGRCKVRHCGCCSGKSKDIIIIFWMYFCDKNMSWRKINENAPKPTLLANIFLHIRRCSKNNYRFDDNKCKCGLTWNEYEWILWTDDSCMSSWQNHGGNRNAFSLSWCRSSPSFPVLCGEYHWGRFYSQVTNPISVLSSLSGFRPIS